VTAEDKRVPRWLIAALVLGPLLRYEGAAVTLGGALALAWLGHWRARAPAGARGAPPLPPVSLFPLSPAPSPLPPPGVGHAAVAAAGVDGSILGFFDAVWRTLEGLPPAGMLIGIFALAILAKALPMLRANPRAPQIAVALFALTVAAAHLMVGRYGWFYRFE